MKKTLSLLCACALLLGLLLPIAASAYQLMYVVTGNHGTLNVRSTPSASSYSNVMGEISYGSAVELIEILDGGVWAQVHPVNWNNTGYVKMEFLSYSNPSGGGSSGSWVIDSGNVADIFDGFTLVSSTYSIYAKPERSSGWVNLRWAPSTKAAVQAMCYNGRMLRVVAENTYWYQATDSRTGYTGFILKEYTTFGGYGSSY